MNNKPRMNDVPSAEAGPRSAPNDATAETQRPAAATSFSAATGAR
jgi:hypothetical protein